MSLELLNNLLLFQYNYPNYYNSILTKSNIELFKNKSLTPSCEYFIFLNEYKMIHTVINLYYNSYTDLTKFLK